MTFQFFHCNCQVGFVLYPPSGFPTWNTDDHSQMMMITVMFSVHLAIILMFQAILGAIIYRVSNIQFSLVMYIIDKRLSFLQKVKKSGSFHVVKLEDYDSECDLILDEKEPSAEA